MTSDKHPSSPKPRVFIGLMEVAGYYTNLCSGLRSLGFKADMFILSENRFHYPDLTSQSKLLRAIKSLESRRSPDNVVLVRAVSLILGELLLAVLLLTSVSKYDVFIFSFGKTFLRTNVDLLLLRLLGKKIIVNVGHGSDSRPPLLDGSRLDVDSLKFVTFVSLVFAGMVQKLRLRRIEKLAHVVIGAPNYSFHALKRPFVNTFVFGLPMTLESLSREPLVSKDAGDPVRIFHAPSSMRTKGSSGIAAIIAKLQNDGRNIEFVVASGLPHHEALRLMSTCDLVVDQLFSDSPLSGVSAEACAMGVPAVISGFGLGSLPSCIPKEYWPPVIISSPSGLQITLENLIRDKANLKQLGEFAKNHARGNWNQVRFAEKFALLFGSFPDSWLVSPKSQHGVWTYGFDEIGLRKLARILKRYPKLVAFSVSDGSNLLSAIDHLIACDSSDHSPRPEGNPEAETGN